MFIVSIVPCALARNVGTMLGWRASLAAWPAARFFWLRAGRSGTCLRGASVDANDGIHGRAVRWVSRRSLSAAKGGGANEQSWTYFHGLHHFQRCAPFEPRGLGHRGRSRLRWRSWLTARQTGAGAAGGRLHQPVRVVALVVLGAHDLGRGAAGPDRPVRPGDVPSSAAPREGEALRKSKGDARWIAPI